MGKQNIRPAWWKLYLIVGVGLGLMVLDARAPLSEAGHEITECGLLVLIYALIWLWVRASGLGLLQATDNQVRQKGTSEQHPTVHTCWTPPPEIEAGGNGDGDHGLAETARHSPAQVERERN